MWHGSRLASQKWNRSQLFMFDVLMGSLSTERPIFTLIYPIRKLQFLVQKKYFVVRKVYSLTPTIVCS